MCWPMSEIVVMYQPIFVCIDNNWFDSWYWFFLSVIVVLLMADFEKKALSICNLVTLLHDRQIPS